MCLAHFLASCLRIWHFVGSSKLDLVPCQKVDLATLCCALTYRDFVARLEILTLFNDLGVFAKVWKMCKMNHFTLCYKSGFVLFTTLPYHSNFLAGLPMNLAFLKADFKILALLIWTPLLRFYWLSKKPDKIWLLFFFSVRKAWLW